MARRKTYLQNAALLTACGLVLRVLGMGFRVVLSSYLGGEGMGLYQLILAVYMVFVSLATAGINVASARLAAQSLARGRGMAATLRGLCGTALLFGCCAMLLQMLLAEPAARYLLHDTRAILALQILAPSLPFMAAAGAVRGCFLAARRVHPNVIAQLIEQIIRMAIAIAALRVLAQWGAGYGCAAVVLGSTVSEGISCALMFAFAAKTPEFARRADEPLQPYTQKELYAIVLPVEGSRLLASGLQAVESSLIPYTLALYTGSRADAMAQYGSLKGMALPLLFFPFSVLSALSGLLMPEITRAHTKGDTDATRRLVFTMLKVTGAFSSGGGDRVRAVRCAPCRLYLSRRRGRGVCAHFRLCRAVHVFGKHGGRRAERVRGTAGHILLFAGGFHLPYRRHLAAAAALRHGGIPRHHDHLQPVHLHVKPDPHAALHTKTAP